MTTFDGLALPSALREALDRIGYVEMTPIQADALPVMLEGRDVTGQAQTGSGKTAAFGLALLCRVDPASRSTQALVVCPTRELAEQVGEELRRLGQSMRNLHVLTLCGGRPIVGQRASLAHACQVVVGTPGRLADHLRGGDLILEDLSVLVLDEADRMLDMGFVDEVEAIAAACPAERQTLLFSATFPAAIRSVAAALQRDPLFVEVAARVEAEALRQQAVSCAQGERGNVVFDLLAAHRPSRALVFCATRDDCVGLCGVLRKRGVAALALHGRLDQRDRDDVLLQLAHESTRVVVATDVAARGLDIPALPLVIVAELSKDPEVHLHRIGRTARAGEEGLAVSVVEPAEEQRRERIEELLGDAIEDVPRPAEAGTVRFAPPPNRTLMLLSGRKDKLRKGDVLGALVKDGGLPAEAIGRIDLMPHACAVAVAREHAEAALAHVLRGRIKRKRVRGLLLGAKPRRSRWG